MSTSLRISELRVWLAFLAALFLGISGCDDGTPVQNNGTETVSGFLRDANDKPLADALVEAVQQQDGLVLARDTSAANGAFVLQGLPVALDSVNLRILHGEHGEHILNLAAAIRKAGKRTDIVLNLDDSCCGSLTVCVKDRADSSNLAGVEIRLRANGTTLATQLSDSLGKAVFENICPGEYDIRLAAEGFDVQERELAIDSCAELLKTVYLESRDTCCSSIVKIIAKDTESGAAIPNASVKLRREGQIFHNGYTNGDGNIVFDGVCAGHYEIRIAREGYTVQEFLVEVECNETREIIRELEAQAEPCCTGVLKVLVKNSANGQPLPHATLTLWRNGEKVETVQSNQSGMAIIDGICKGSYGVDVEHPEFKGLEFTFEIDCNQTKEFTKQLVPKENGDCCRGVIKFIVKNGEGQRLANAHVILKRNGQEVETLVTNNDGIAVFDGLCEGGYVVVIEREGYQRQQFETGLDCNQSKEIVREMLANGQHECCDGSIRIVIKNSEGETGINDVLVKIWKNGQLYRSGETNANGVVEFGDICEGVYGVSLLREGFGNIEFELDVDCNEQVNITKLLEQHSGECCTARLKLRLLDAANEQVLHGVLVTIKLEGQVIATGQSNQEGWYVREALCAPRTYVVDLSKEGYNSQNLTISFQECNTFQETVRLQR